MPLILSFISISAAVVFILAYLLIYFIRSLGYDVRAISGYITMKQHMKIDWNELLEDLENESSGSMQRGQVGMQVIWKEEELMQEYINLVI